MGTVFRHEMKEYKKSLLIWFACVGGLGLFCILLYSSMQESMEGMAENFASMGAFSEAFGMDQLSIATLAGFYATEVGTIFGLGGAMFAAIIATTLLSKEEDGHTGEFLLSLPLSRGKIVIAKWCAAITNIILFNVLCVGMYMMGFLILGENIEMKKFFLYHGMQLFMQVEIAAICYAISSFMKKNKLGLGLGIVLLMYAYDLMARVIPDLSDYKIISPYSYANAADIFSTGEIEIGATVLGAVVLVIGICTAYVVYSKRDMAT